MNITLGQISDFIVNLKQTDAEFSACYEKNRCALNSYLFWRKEPLPNFYELPIIPLAVDSTHFSWFDKNQRCFGRVIKILRTKSITHSFFQELEKPLLVENEFNTYHWEYLHDNVRSSEDYGGDNHIYLYYSTIESFLLFICREDITPYLFSKKFVFLFAEERGLYPINYEKYGIKYKKTCQPNPIRIEEIQRIIANLGYFSSSGNDFTYGIFDWHKNLLTMCARGMPDYTILYRLYFFNKTPKEFEEDYLSKNMDQLVYKSIETTLSRLHDIQLFFLHIHMLWPKIEIPNRVEWIKLIFLAYSTAVGRNFNSRIVPAIMFNTHANVSFPGDSVWNYNEEFFFEFKYTIMIIPFRYPIVSAASMNYAWATRSGRIEKEGKTYLQTLILSRVLNRTSVLSRGLFVAECDKRYICARIVRLEDLKLHTKAMLTSLCEYFDIEWDDVLERVTSDGKDAIFYGTSGYDPAPVYKRYFDICNPFDYYRLEVVTSKYWKHWGYKPLFYKENITYTKEEILKMFELPFQCEKFDVTEVQKEAHNKTRKEIYARVTQCIQEGNVPLDKNGEKIVPILWLKPKQELLEGELYH